MLLQLGFTILSAFLFMSVITAQQHQTPLYEKCYKVNENTSRCYFLYGDRLAQITWQMASARCSSNNKTMAIIGDKNTNRRVENFLKGAAGLSSTGVWIGGRRSGDNTWKYLHSEAREMLNGNFPSDRYCALRQKLNAGVLSVSCTEKHIPLCEYKTKALTVTNEGCDGGLLHSIGVCLSFGLYPVTWFEARNYCRDKHQDGDLATINGDMSHLEKTSPSNTDLGYWIGLERRPWMWITENGQIPISYYGFEHGEGSDKTQSCLFLKLTTDGTVYWADLFCNQSLNYYLCEIETSVPTEVNDSSVQSEHSIKLTVVHIVVIVTLAVAIIVLALLVFVFIRRRQRTKREQNKGPARKVESKFGESGQNITTLRPAISAPLPMTAPFPVSGYDNLGMLIHVKPNNHNRDMMPVRAEITSDGASGHMLGE